MNLRPSSAHVWVNCPGVISMTVDYPSVGSPESLAGGAVHELATKMIDLYRRALSPLPGNFIGKPATNGIIVDAEMFEAANLYALDVKEVMQSTRIFGGEYLGVEHFLLCPEIHSSMCGTCDCFIFHRQAKHLFLWEYKNGHRIVDECENWQAISYLSGLISKYDIDGIEDQSITVHFRIVQPRAYHANGAIREWTFRLSDIRGHINKLRAAVVEALSTSPRVQSGEHCRDCAARHDCPTARNAAVTLYEAAGLAVPEKMSDESIGLFYRILLRAQEQIKCMEAGISEEIKSRLQGGNDVPGFALQPSEGREVWTRPVTEIIALGNLIGFNLRKEETITPNQARKVGVDESIIREYASRQQNGFKLVTQKDASKSFKRIFG
jgi:hypothetical protein